MDRFDLAHEGSHQARQTACSYYLVKRSVRPLVLDPAYDAIHGVGGPQQDTRADRVVRAAPDRPGGWRQVGRGELGGTTDEGVGSRADAGHDDAAEKVTIGGDAVERGRRAEVHDNRVSPKELRGGEGVENAVGADLQRLFHVKRDR